MSKLSKDQRWKDATESIEWYWVAAHTVGGWVRKLAPAQYLACTFDSEGNHRNIATVKSIVEARKLVEYWHGVPA